MHLAIPAPPSDPQQQRLLDRRRWRRAFNLSLAAILLLCGIFVAQSGFDVDPWTVQPGHFAGLRGVVTAPLLHGSFAHLGSNAIALLVLGTLAGAQYPRALVRLLPLAWLASGTAAWLLGDVGSHHLGASGVLSGVMFMLLTLGVLRRDRPSVAVAMVALLFFGGMLLSVLPHEPGVSWQSHLGGAMAGVFAGLVWRHADPLPPRLRYSWEDDEENIDVDGEVVDPSSQAAHRASPHARVASLNVD